MSGLRTMKVTIMKRSKRFPTTCAPVLAIIFLGLAHSVVGQDVREVKGRVIDAATRNPIPTAHVFYSGTTIGDASDADGRFQLPHPRLDQVDLIVSMLGYATQKMRIERLSFDFSEQIIELVPSVIELGEMEIVGDVPLEWKRNLIRFEALLFSTTDYGKDCEIENPEVLRLSYDDDRDSLSASARIPLRIVNRALGYQVTVHDVKLDGNERGYRFSGELQFRELPSMNAKEQEKWRERRAEIYTGSMRHFLRALVSHRLEEEGFAAYHVTRPGQKLMEAPIAEMNVASPDSEITSRIVTPGSSPASRFITFSGSLFIHNMREDVPEAYHRHLKRLKLGAMTVSDKRFASNQLSWLTLPLYTAEVDTSGIVYTDVEGFPMAHYGYWAWERFGEMLPTDYVPQNEL